MMKLTTPKKILIIFMILNVFLNLIFLFINESIFIHGIVILELLTAGVLLAGSTIIPIRTTLVYYVSAGLIIRGILDIAFIYLYGIAIDFSHHSPFLFLNFFSTLLLLTALLEATKYNYKEWEYKRILVEIIKSTLVIAPLIVIVHQGDFYNTASVNDLFVLSLRFFYTAVLVVMFIIVILNIISLKIFTSRGAQLGFFIFYFWFIADHVLFIFANTVGFPKAYLVSAVFRYLGILGIIGSGLHRYTLHLRGIRFERAAYNLSRFQENRLPIFTALLLVTFRGLRLLTLRECIILFLLFIGIEVLDFISRRSSGNDADLIKKLSMDNLTGLHNRTYFIEEIHYRIAKDSSAFTLFFLDLNRFKIINDIHGHAIGDEVLKVIGNRLKAVSTQELLIARLGGDEFACLLDGVDDARTKGTAEHIAALVEQTIFVDTNEFYLTLSMGIARFPIDATQAVDLLKYADIAMYAAKKSERTYIVHSTAMAYQNEQRNQLEILLHAISFDDAFTLYYQPQIDTRTGVICGAEALIRWELATGECIPPSEFIPIAEECGLIKKVSTWVLEKAAQQIYSWNSTYKKDLTLYINVSPLDISDPKFYTQLRRIIEEFNLTPEHLGIEITEYTAMVASAGTEDILLSIHELGIKIAIDDFGTGYSSLAYLKKIEAQELKIARELVETIAQSTDDYMIIRAIISMAKGLGLSTIAEGVESQIQLDILEDLGCDTMQGYYFSRPIPADEFEAHYLKSALIP